MTDLNHALKKCNLCQDFVTHWTFQCPKLKCAKCNENGHARKDCAQKSGEDQQKLESVVSEIEISGQLDNCELECVEDNVQLDNLPMYKASKTYVFIKTVLCASGKATAPINSAISIRKSKDFPTKVTLITKEITLKKSPLEVFDIVIMINRNCKDLSTHSIIKQLRAMF